MTIDENERHTAYAVLRQMIDEYLYTRTRAADGSDVTSFADGRHSGALQLARELGISVPDHLYGRIALNRAAEKQDEKPAVADELEDE